MKFSIIVPCFNEADNVSKLHKELLPVIENLVKPDPFHAENESSSAELVFVDDGSRDETSSRLQEEFGAGSASGITYRYARHDHNQGLGAALRTGFSLVSGDVIVTVDSDGTYDFSCIPALLSVLGPEVDIVTASPYHPLGHVVGVPAYRLFLSRGSSFLYRILLDWHIYTYTCLFRAYRSRVIKDITFGSNGFLAGTEILVNGILQGYRVAEYPAVLHRRQYGVSKARITKTMLSHLRFQAWILLRRIQLRLGSSR